MAPQIIDLTESDDELGSVSHSRAVDNTYLRRSMVPTLTFLPPLLPRVVSIIPSPKRRKINEGTVEIIPKDPVIGSVPNNAIVIDDDDDDSMPPARPLNVEIQTASIFQSPGNAIVRQARANRLGTSAPRVSKRGKIQKPSRGEGPILIDHEFHGKMVNALRNQVFTHIQSALASYVDILGKPTCTDIGSKVAGQLAEEPGFVEDLMGNNWKLSERFEQSIAVRAQERVTEHATKVLRELEENTQNEHSNNGNPPIDDSEHTVKPKRESLPESPTTLNGGDVREWDYAKYRWTIDGTPSSSTLNSDTVQNEQQSSKGSQTPTTTLRNNPNIEATDSDSQKSKTRPNKANNILNHRVRQLRERRSIVYRSQRKYVKKSEGTIPQQSVHTTLNSPFQNRNFDTIHKIQMFQFAGLDPEIHRPYIKANDRELIRRGLRAMHSEPISQVFSAMELELLKSVTLHVDLCLEEVEFLCRVLSTEFGNKEPRHHDSGIRLISLMRGDSSNIDWFIRRIREALMRPSQDLGARFLRNRDENSIRAILEDASEGHFSLEGRISRITSNRKSPLRRNRPSLSSLLRQREVFGNSSTRLSRGQRSFNSAVSICFEESLIRKSEWTDCCGDISTVTWINEDTFVCGAIAHSDFHNMQYNKPGNLLVGNTSMDTLRSIADHRIIRPLVSSNDNIENSLLSMRETQDSWLYTSVVSTAHSNISGYTFTASFDETVKIWKVCETGSTLELQGTWKHDGKVNFVVTSEWHSLIATASDVSNDAIRVYSLDTRDISKSVYNTYTGDKAHEQAQELQRQDKWAYYPATMQWGRSDSVVNLLAVGYSPRSVTGNDFDIPEDKRNTGELCIWNAKSGYRVPFHAARAQNVFEIIWHPTQPVFLAATSPAGPCEPDIKTQIRMFAQNEVGAFLQIKSLDCTAIDINELTMRPMGFIQCFVTASCTDGSTYVWDTAQGDRPIHVLRHEEPLEAQLHDVPREISDSGVKFAAWGKSTSRFYTGSSDGIVKVWDVQAPKGKAFVCNVISVSGGISVGAFSKDFSKLILGDASGKVHFLEVEHGEDLTDTETKEEETPYTNIIANSVPFAHTRKRPKLIIPHPEPEPPENGSAVAQNPQHSGRQLARTFLEEGRLILHSDRAIGPIQGPNYAETRLYRKECHEDGDENKPLLPNFQKIQQEEVGKLQPPTNIPRLPRVASSDIGRHEMNVLLDLEKSGLPLSCREELKQEGVDLDFEQEHNFDMELMPPRKFFKRLKDH